MRQTISESAKTQEQLSGIVGKQQNERNSEEKDNGRRSYFIKEQNFCRQAF